MNRSMRGIARKTLPILFLLTSLPLAHGQVPSLEGLDSYVEKAMAEWHVPGLALGIVKEDSLIYARGFGVRELGKPAEVDERTLFAVASNTKAFTAALLGMLVEEGKLRWEDRATAYLKGFQLYDPYVTREINIRDLLTHRSGLPTFGGDHLWIGGSQSRDEILNRIRYLKPASSFRSKFHYQNLMYLAAGQVIPAITGESWEDMLKKRIFDSLSMRESNTSVHDLKNRENVAAPHEVVGGKLVPIDYDDVDPIAPAAAVNSNVVEMAQWIRLHLAGGVYEGKQILSPETIREMQAVHMPIPISSSREKMLGTQFAGYGLGWGISDYKGRKVVGHGGGLSGMISIQTMIPSEMLGVVVLTNYAPNSLPRALTYRILDAFLGEPERDWSAEYLAREEKAKAKKKKAKEEREKKRVKDTKPSHRLERYTGKYFNDLSGEAEILLEKGKLVFRYNPRYIGDLEHWHYDTFWLTWRHPIYDMSDECFLAFSLDERGHVAELKVAFYDPILFQKRPGLEGDGSEPAK